MHRERRIERTETSSVFVLAFLVMCSSDWRGGQETRFGNWIVEELTDFVQLPFLWSGRWTFRSYITPRAICLVLNSSLGFGHFQVVFKFVTDALRWRTVTLVLRRLSPSSADAPQTSFFINLHLRLTIYSSTSFLPGIAAENEDPS